MAANQHVIPPQYPNTYLHPSYPSASFPHNIPSYSILVFDGISFIAVVFIVVFDSRCIVLARARNVGEWGRDRWVWGGSAGRW